MRYVCDVLCFATTCITLGKWERGRHTKYELFIIIANNKSVCVCEWYALFIVFLQYLYWVVFI